MPPIVDVEWAKRHPRRAARIQIAYLLLRVWRRRLAQAKEPAPEPGP